MTSSGITSSAALEYQRAHGYNEIVEKKESLAHKIAKRSFTFISGMLLLAALLSLLNGKQFDFFFILGLLVLNIAITVWQEHKADTAIEELNKQLSTSVKALRDGAWVQLPSRELIPGDLITLRSGSIVPADAKVAEAKSASVNEAALTGESLPKDIAEGGALYSGSFIASGLVTAEVTAIGNATRFGATITHVDRSAKRSALERDILRISRFLSILSLCAVAALSALLIAHHASVVEVLRLDLSLVIAGIPISLPTVMTLIIAFGTVALAKKQVIVRRLSALEELANTNFLLTDKTGTLTENRIEVNRVVNYDSADIPQVLALAGAVAAQDPDNDINAAILHKAGTAPSLNIEHYVPGDSTRKRSTLTVQEDGKPLTLSLGAPQTIGALCAMSPQERTRFESDVAELAKHGYRSLALAKASGADERGMTLIGLLSLSDQVRADAADTIRFLNENGIGVAMVTGDDRAIAQEVARKLQIPGSGVRARAELFSSDINAAGKELFANTQAFAEILPEDKLALITAAKKYYTVAANGDGVNDLPAVTAADVGFAVKNAVDALKGAADIVLLFDGIAVMKDAFIEGRKIFARLYSYSLYRISESFRLIVTIAILGLLTGTYPLSPLQLILLAVLNDVPIISLATDRVKVARSPASINVREQFTRSVLFGCVGVVNSMIVYVLAVYYWHLPMPVVQTLFFLKLTVSGHLLIYVAHTRERWWRFLPSNSVIAATAATQAVATLLALTGLFMPAALPWPLVIFIWLWSALFMQISEVVKPSQPKSVGQAYPQNATS